MEIENGNVNPRVSFCRDFPPGCGISSSILNNFPDSSSFHQYIRDFPLGFSSNSPNSSTTTTKFQDYPPNGVFRSESTTWRRNASAVKIEPQNVKPQPQKVYSCSERKSEERERKVGKEEVMMSNSDEGGSKEREKVVEILRLFRKRCSEMSSSGGIRRIDMAAYNELKNKGILVNRSAMMIGDVPGVEIGDKFHYRIELVFVGLHKQTQGGIDSMEWGGGRIATSIVANERHSDKMNDPNSLVYIGEGGVLKRHEVGVPPDQELKSGNRALWCSMNERKPVRVIRGLASEKSSNQKVLYVYDGLYDVTGCDKKKGPQGNMIFEFLMVRRSGQPAVSWQQCRRYQF